ncbi:hypothetical protein GCM10027168_15870 [Streptomyces capparidis]
MAMETSKVDFLPKGIGSLSRGLPPAQPGTLFVLGTNGGLRVAPDADFRVLFGRNAPDVHVCVGAGDTYVSRRHGLITRESSRWVLRNTGTLPVRFPGSRLLLGGHRAELPTGYTPLFIVAPRQEHLLEVRIAAPEPSPTVRTAQDPEGETREGDARKLNEQERLVLVCLAQRYLRNDFQPQPLTWAQLAFELGRLRPGEAWTPKRAAHVVDKVRRRLSRDHGVPGLLEEEIPPPIGNALNHNLITDLLVTTTITTDDLCMLGE